MSMKCSKLGNEIEPLSESIHYSLTDLPRTLSDNWCRRAPVIFRLFATLNSVKYYNNGTIQSLPSFTSFSVNCAQSSHIYGKTLKWKAFTNKKETQQSLYANEKEPSRPCNVYVHMYITTPTLNIMLTVNCMHTTLGLNVIYRQTSTIITSQWKYSYRSNRDFHGNSIV